MKILVLFALLAYVSYGQICSSTAEVDCTQETPNADASLGFKCCVWISGGESGGRCLPQRDGFCPTTLTPTNPPTTTATPTSPPTTTATPTSPPTTTATPTNPPTTTATPTNPPTTTATPTSPPTTTATPTNPPTTTATPTNPPTTTMTPTNPPTTTMTPTNPPTTTMTPTNPPTTTMTPTNPPTTTMTPTNPPTTTLTPTRPPTTTATPTTTTTTATPTTTTTGTPTGTTTVPPIIVTKTPDYCFCEDYECPSDTASTSTSSWSWWRRRMKGKKSKDTSGDIGGICDCDCDKSIGMKYMALRNMNTYPISIVFSGSRRRLKGKGGGNKASGTICTVTGVTQGGEAVCDLTTGSLTFPTNTGMVIKNLNTGTECATTLHTSCSSDIIGAQVCGMKVVRWKDDSLCKDPIQQCDCGGTYVPEFPDPTEVPQVEVTKDVCYCSTRSDGYTSLSQLAQAATTSRRRMKGKKNKPSLGVGSCDCDKSTKMQVIRWKWMGSTPADSITVYYDDSKSSSDIICRVSDISVGEEFECRIDAATGSSARSAGRFNTNTYITVVAGGASCPDAEIHTSCSSDIVGYAADNCDGLICTGWADGDGYCDDGFEECVCDANANAFRLISAAHSNSAFHGLCIAAIGAIFAYLL